MPAIPKPILRAGEVNHLRIDPDQAGRRIDNLLLSLLGDVPKSHIYKMLRRGEVRLNGRRVRPEARVQADDVVRVPPVRREPVAATPAGAGRRGEYLLSQILFEDDSILVINKPAGMAVHGGTGLRFGLIETLRNAREGGEFLELAHRLDRDTSGCLIIAKTMRALRRLHDELRNAGIGKHYLLLARGVWKGGTCVIESSLSRNTRTGGEAVVRVDEGGKRALTRFALQRQFTDACLLGAEIETGRTHQIRVHAAHAGHPLAGDDKYGDPAFNVMMRERGLRRLFLHAARVEIPLASATAPLVVEAPVPEDLEAMLQTLAAAS